MQRLVWSLLALSAIADQDRHHGHHHGGDDRGHYPTTPAAEDHHHADEAQGRHHSHHHGHHHGHHADEAQGHQNDHHHDHDHGHGGAQDHHHGEFTLGDGPHEEVVPISWPAGRRLSMGAAPRDFHMVVNAFNCTFTMRLVHEPAFIHGRYRQTFEYANGTTFETPLKDRNAFFQVVVDEDPNGRGGLRVDHRGVHGLVIAHGEVLALEPEGPDDVRVARLAHALQQRHPAAHMFHHVQDLVIKAAENQTRRLQATSTKFVEILLVNDYLRYKDFTTVDELAADSVTIMNAVTAIYRNPPTQSAQFPHQMQVVLVAQHTFLEADPWEATVKTSGSEVMSDSLLDLFHDWAFQAVEKGVVPAHDNRVLVSSRDFDGNTLGLAGVSAMCSPSRTGNVNQCMQGAERAVCASVVAHEIGHNLGMHHDSSGNSCPQSGLIMNAVLSGTAPDTFSKCSVDYINGYFSELYGQSVGACMDDKPTKVFGDPQCRNGFVEEGEDCDCGKEDCTGLDDCCDGSTCKFKDPSFTCSNDLPCCTDCKFATAESKKVCRAALNTCDLPETCAGDSADCPADVHSYPGIACKVGEYDGACFGGECHSLDATCAVDMNREFGDTDQTPTCAAFNDDCGALVCHHKGQSYYQCRQDFIIDGKPARVPTGTPCWYPDDPRDVRRGVCFQRQCVLPHTLAVVPKCGNGGIDFGEQCDCGVEETDPCCDCGTCRLKADMDCSAQDPCCTAECKFAAAGVECRAAVDSCDAAEVCTGDSPVCPKDAGEAQGTACGDASTCFGRGCVESFSSQCDKKTSGAEPIGKKSWDVFDMHSSCQSLICCEDENTCSTFTRSSTFTFTAADGTETTQTIWLGGAEDGTEVTDGICRRSEAVAAVAAADCTADQYFAASVAQCNPCDPGCQGCSGPSNFDCTACRFGTADSRGACASSQATLDLSTDGDASDGGTTSGDDNSGSVANSAGAWSIAGAVGALWLSLLQG